jgi:hypothetical protein
MVHSFTSGSGIRKSKIQNPNSKIERSDHKHCKYHSRNPVGCSECKIYPAQVAGFDNQMLVDHQYRKKGCPTPE